METLLQTETKGALFLLVVYLLNDSLSVLCGSLYLMIMHSSEYWVPWIYGEYSHLTLPTIFSLYFLKCVNQSSAVGHPLSNYLSFTWSNITFILNFLDVTSLIHTSGSRGVILTTVYNISSI